MSEQLFNLLLLMYSSTIIINQLAMAGLPLRVVGQLRFRGGGEDEAEEEEVPEQDPPVQVAARAPEDKAETPTPKRKIQFGIGKFFGSPEAKSSAKPVGDTSITPQSRPTKRKNQLVDQLMIEQLAERNAELEAMLPGSIPEEVYKNSRLETWRLRRRSHLALGQRKRGPKRELTAAKKLLIIQRLKEGKQEHDPQTFWKVMQNETGLRKEQLSHLLKHEDHYASLSQKPLGRNKAANKKRKRASGAGRKAPFPEVRHRLSDWLELQRACGVTVTNDHLISHSFALLKESAEELLDRAASDKSLSPLQVGKLKAEAQLRKDKVNSCLRNTEARRSWGRYLLKWIGAKHLTTDLVQPLDENEAAIRCQLTWQEFDHRLWLSSCSSVQRLKEASVVANPKAFCDNREHLIIGFSDQVPLWAKDTGRKGIFSASELHSKEHKKDFSEVREAIAEVVNTEKAADFLVGPLREAKKPLRRSSTGSISSSAVRRALSFGSEPSTPGRPAEPEEKPEQQPPAEQPEQQPPAEQPEQPPSQQPVSDQPQQPQPLCDQPEQVPVSTRHRGKQPEKQPQNLHQPGSLTLIGHANEERFRITYEARQLLRNVFGDPESPVLGVVGKGLLVVPGQWARLSNISEDGKFIEAEQFKVGSKKILRGAGT